MVTEYSFSAVLTGFKVIRKDDSSRYQLTLRNSVQGEVQKFLKSYAEKCDEANVASLFCLPVPWKSISIEAAYKFKVTFDSLEFEAVLREIKVRKAFVNGNETFTYDLILTKDPDTHHDLILPEFVLQKERNSLGKLVLCQFDVLLEPLERLMKS